MQRRAFLATISTVTIVGCTDEDASGDEDIESEDRWNPAEGVTEDWGEDIETEHLITASPDVIEITESLEYNDGSNEIREYDLERERFVLVRIAVRNDGVEEVDIPELSSFQLITENETVEPVKELPNGLEWDQLRGERFSKFDPLPTRIAPDLAIAFDIPFKTELESGYFRWQPSFKIDGEALQPMNWKVELSKEGRFREF